MITKGIILRSVNKLQAQRTSGAIFHLLQGKRSIQTVQDAYLFGLDRYYRLIPTLTRTQFDHLIHQLMAKGLLTEEIKESKQILHLTDNGERFIEKQSFNFHYFNGLRYVNRDDIFYKRLLLMIQVLTNQYKQYHSYIPIVNDVDVQQWIKQMYNKIKNHIEQYLLFLYDDLHLLFNHLPDYKVNLIVDRFSGYNHIGLSTHQLSEKYKLTKNDVFLYIQATIHQLLNLIFDHHFKTKVIHLLVEDLPQIHMMTQSAQKTLKLLKQDLTIEQICDRRRLKKSTILDHLIEISWLDQTFEIDQYVTPTELNEIKRAIRETNSLQLRKIKAVVGDDISYFQIRLGLSRLKNVFAKGDTIGQ